MITKRLLSLLLVLSLTSFSCSTKKKVVDDDFGVEDETGTELTLDDTADAATADPNAKDEFAELNLRKKKRLQLRPRHLRLRLKKISKFLHNHKKWQLNLHHRWLMALRPRSVM